MKRFTDNGYTIVPVKEGTNMEGNPFSEFDGRIPFLYEPPTRRIYMGGPDWYHADTADHHGLDYWNGDYAKGYLGSGNKRWGGGNIEWYNKPQEGLEVEQALIDAGYHTPKSEAVEPAWDDEDLWED